MHVKIHTHQLDMSDPLRTYAERHIAEAIGNIFKRQAATLDIEFSDAMGGRERACKVTFFIPHGKTLVANAQDVNPYAAVDLVAEKIGREVRRYKEKRQDQARQGRSKSLANQGPVFSEEENEHMDEFVEAEAKSLAEAELPDPPAAQ